MDDSDLFEVLGIRPMLGRAFTEADGGNVVVLSHGYWRRRFGADPNIIGTTYRETASQRWSSV